MAKANRLHLAALLLIAMPSAAQTRSTISAPAPVPPSATPTTNDPLPDIPALMRAVEANARTSEAVQKDYIYRESVQFDELDSHEGVKKTHKTDAEIFWINGVRVRRETSKNGKPLTTDELAKENARIDEVARKAKEKRDKADAAGKETDSHGRDEITVARILELGAFSHPRRQQVNGRDTIVVDYLGDQHAKTHNTGEGIFKELAGTVWIDEQDRTVQRIEAHFDHDFKIAGGLVASVRQGTWFKASFRKINNEVWLPQTFEGDGHARYLLFFSLTGHAIGQDSEYRKFKATSTVLPTFTPVPDEPQPPAPPPPS